MDVGLVGQPNVGKSTLFNALTLLHVPMAPYPFTTVEPNRGVSHVRVPCPHPELGRPCQPGNAPCEDSVRWVPVQLVDVAGLVPGAHQGRGLGNRFLDDLRQAEGFLQVVDLTGATGPEGNRSAPHTFDPAGAVRFLEEELVLWLAEVLGRQWDKLSRSAELTGGKPDELLAGRLAGLGFTLPQVQAAIRQSALDPAHPSRWEDAALPALARTLITTHRPRWVVANKADESTPPEAEKLRQALSPLASSPASAEVELTLRRADQAGLVRYRPGDSRFARLRPDALSAGQARALEGIDRFLSLWRTTGVQEALEGLVFTGLQRMVVFPVEDETHWTDSKGRVLPDALLVPRGITARQLAYRVHTDLGEGFLKAVDGRRKRTLGADHPLEPGDVIRVISHR